MSLVSQVLAGLDTSRSRRGLSGDFPLVGAAAVTSLFACFGFAILVACAAQRSNSALLRCGAQLLALPIAGSAARRRYVNAKG